MKGKLITFEGIDGSGKTTIVNILGKMIENSVITYEPTNTWLGKSVKKAMDERKDAMTIALLFLADRIEHIKEIKKWLDEGKIVLCDRYIDSTIAYQIEHLKKRIKNPERWIKNIHEPFLLKPDLTFLFVLPVNVAIKRIGNRKKTIFEKKEFLERVQENYIKIAENEKDRFVIVDANKSKEDVANECYKKIKRL